MSRWLVGYPEGIYEAPAGTHVVHMEDIYMVLQQLEDVNDPWQTQSSLWIYKHWHALKDVTLCNIPMTIDFIRVFESITALTFAICPYLVSLPRDMIYLHALTELRIHDCECFTEFGDYLGGHLKTLDIRRCHHLTNIPRAVGLLCDLETLSIHSCMSLMDLPKSMEGITRLTKLEITDCQYLTSLPAKMCPVKSLVITKCFRMQSLSDMRNVENLELEDCVYLTALPETMWDLDRLETLSVVGCPLIRLPEARNSVMKLKHFGLLDEVTGECVKRVSDNWFWRVADRRLPDSLGCFKTITRLEVLGNVDMTILPDSIGELQCLQYLDLTGCSHLKSLPDSIGQVVMLRLLCLKRCRSLKALPDALGRVTKLEELKLMYCTKLTELPETIGHVDALHVLDLKNCTRLKRLPTSVNMLKHLQILDLDGCVSLHHQEVIFWENLIWLNIKAMRAREVIMILIIHGRRSQMSSIPSEVWYMVTMFADALHRVDRYVDEEDEDEDRVDRVDPDADREDEDADWTDEDAD